jgi:uncharacterized RDD family membrane protein YckC
MLKFDYLFRRGVAHGVDILVVVVPLTYLVPLLPGRLGIPGESVTVIGGPLLLLYMILSEGRFGQSLGKKLFGLKVKKENGKKIGMKEAVIRNLLRVIDVLPMYYIAGIVILFVNKKHQRIGDLAAKTVVVRGK